MTKQGEQFLIRMVGGPNPGQRVCREGEDWGFIVSWPLPEFFNAEGGKYVKVSESQLPPQSSDSHVIRGAEYQWVRNPEDIITPIKNFFEAI